MRAVVRGLNVHPIKSAGGIAVPSAEITAVGLRGDREFLVIRPDGRHLSQREVPGLARLRPIVEDGKLRVEVEAPGDSAALAYEPFDGPARRVNVHGTDCEGVDQGDDVAEWFSTVLGLPCRLVRFTGTRRTPRGDTLTYDDGDPISVLSVESLADLNERLTTRLEMRRFRPNIVLEGLGPYGEDRVSRLRIGAAVEIEVIRPSGRCVIINTDQDTGERRPEPLRALGGYRVQIHGGQRAIMFGRLGAARSFGRIAVGDVVDAVERIDDDTA
ncbi:MOSC N-terminal beta barrel domain-containing protein [Actinomadura barringtoniae]|uniref:MOSC N-terminal beta barrel domain-containing protein n=1 Tax=Actinomadura barringtoniae TaxID=1427535 RepID=A0A939T6K8_9ACTN|nr:MOSC N-terminal beta barrel domain-containing protein [Actinomadura barringtoniae]MBO2452063.1 MOSC N-terminal beta barrel domain-containing protein [Actinomadura barringtoniae]